MSDVINLISTSYTADEIGQQIPIESKKEVFCEIESIAQNEFFSASQSGLKPSFRAIMFRYDYNGERLVEYNGIKSTVYRTFVRKDDKIELYITDKVGI